MKVTVKVGDLERTTQRLKEVAAGRRRGSTARGSEESECMCKFPARVSGRCTACDLPCPDPQRLVSSSFVVPDGIDHITVYPGHGLRCDSCADGATYFRRCTSCKKSVCRCSQHAERPARCCAQPQPHGGTA